MTGAINRFSFSAVPAALLRVLAAEPSLVEFGIGIWELALA